MSEYSIYEKIRNEKGLRDADVSRGTGIATATLSEWKKGRYSHKQDKLEKIATFFACSGGISENRDCSFYYR